MGWFVRTNRTSQGRAAAGRRQAAGADGGSRPDPGASPDAGTHDAEAPGDTIIDLDHEAAEVERQAQAEEDRRRAAELSERFRARRARAEAAAELRRLRERHWSGERIIEEGRVAFEWWEHTEADPYAVLGILPGARLDEAAHARRRIAQACHPDRIDPDTTEGDEALRRMVAANSAYDRLRRALRPV